MGFLSFGPGSSGDGTGPGSATHFAAGSGCWMRLAPTPPSTHNNVKLLVACCLCLQSSDGSARGVQGWGKARNN